MHCNALPLAPQDKRDPDYSPDDPAQERAEA